MVIFASFGFVRRTNPRWNQGSFPIAEFSTAIAPEAADARRAQVVAVAVPLGAIVDVQADGGPGKGPVAQLA